MLISDHFKIKRVPFSLQLFCCTFLENICLVKGFNAVERLRDRLVTVITYAIAKIN